MHGGCYFHHMVLSGIIVVPALSAQIAAWSQIVYFNPLPVSFPPYFTSRELGMVLKDPVGPLTGPVFRWWL